MWGKKTSSEFTLVFPVAGEGSRFGGVFKPLQPIGDITFIGKAYEPFEKFSSSVKEVVCICTEAQNKQHDVVKELTSCIPHDNVRVIVIKEATSGPLKTVQEGIKEGDLKGPVVICDCDHSIDVSPLISSLDSNADVWIPTWKITEDEHHNWSKVMHSPKGIHMICEKEHVASESYSVDGIIGCLWFRDVESLLGVEGDYLSDALKEFVSQRKTMGIVPINTAFFFGTPEMYENCVNQFRKQCTVFCDIDGTLVQHTNHSDCDLDKVKMCAGVQKLSRWKSRGHRIILTTSRNEKYREETEKFLYYLGVRFDEIVMGLPAGPRVLINDRKPSKKFTKSAQAMEISRNQGIEHLSLSDMIQSNDLEVLKTFKGNSFATAYLVSGNPPFVRKHIVKNDTNQIHCEKLRRQAEDLGRLDCYSPGITPKVYNIHENEYELYYDMEYLDGYTLLDELGSKDIDVVLEQMQQDIYSITKQVEGVDWLKTFIKNKLYAKFDKYREDQTLAWLIDSDEVTINGTKYTGLKKTLENLDLRLVKPSFLTPVHGDFTLENIFLKDKDVKLIDMDGGDYLDAPELDLGKMCQSVMSNYKEWRDRFDVISDVNDDKKTITCIEDYFSYCESDVDETLSKWRDILKDNKEGVALKGIFYMATYFIRFVPFRMNVSRYHGIFALVMAIVWISKIKKYNNYV